MKTTLLLIGSLWIAGCAYEVAPEDGAEPVGVATEQLAASGSNHKPDKLTLCVLRCLDVGEQCKRENWPEADCDYVADKCMRDYCSRYFSQPVASQGGLVAGSAVAASD